MKKNLLLLFSIILFSFAFSGCTKDDKTINIFSVDDDIRLGKQFDDELLSKPAEYPVLDSASNVAAYAHLYRIRNTILASGKLIYANRFPWRCRIRKNDTVINAFCVPGGYIYVYTGIIKLLDNEAQFAGVIGHEMTHADRRHTTDMLTLNYGVDLLLQLVLGSKPTQVESILADLAKGLGELAYSRDNEYEADQYAVRYLYVTEEDAPSLGDFFTKISSQSQPPAFLSTHPSPADRLAKINQEFQTLGGIHGGLFPERYQEFKNLLP